MIYETSALKTEYTHKQLATAARYGLPTILCLATSEFAVVIVVIAFTWSADRYGADL